VLDELTASSDRKRVGLKPDGRAPMREGVALFVTADDSTQIGTITSGGFGPTIGTPIAMGYLPAKQAIVGTVVYGERRGKRLPLTVTPLPFTPAHYKS
jgi:aminomethyltransferase